MWNAQTLVRKIRQPMLPKGWQFGLECGEAGL